jgi:hypothetical protein
MLHVNLLCILFACYSTEFNFQDLQRYLVSSYSSVRYLLFENILVVQQAGHIAWRTSEGNLSKSAAPPCQCCDFCC